MWERIGEIANGFALYRRTMLNGRDQVTVFRCTNQGRPDDGEFGGYPLASSALRQKGL